MSLIKYHPDPIFPPKGAVIYVGLSGGVDSSVSARLLKEQEYRVHCVYLKCWGDGDECTAERDKIDALKFCAEQDLPFEVWDYTKEYEEYVLKYFYDTYSKGLTPNPDILCNSKIKFGLFYRDVMKKSPDAYIATGHYARICRTQETIEAWNNSTLLLSGKDKTKDQSYFLYRLVSRSEVLNRCVFPVGSMTKKEVRGLARKSALNTADKRDSQGVCFIGSVKLRQFLKNKVVSMPGKIVDQGGRVLGTHNGVSLYTIGQRHGFRIKKHISDPLYVIGKDIGNNILIVGSRKDACVSKFSISNLSLVEFFDEVLSKSNGRLLLSARVRNLGDKIPCEIVRKSEDVLEVELSQKEFGISPGQSAVVYNGEVLLGGGVIIPK